jgi:hypothetical protein
MPEAKTKQRARQRAKEGKYPCTQAGEFVREEIEHLREGKHGARSTEQAIAIGLSKARRAGVKLPAPKRGSERVRRQAERDLEQGERGAVRPTSRRRARAATRDLGRESTAPASPRAASRARRPPGPATPAGPTPPTGRFTPCRSG